MTTARSPVWDFTDYEYIDNEQGLIDLLNKHCTKWAFQLERGEESGLLHNQGRMRFKEKISIKAIKELIPITKWKLMPTYKENMNNFNYQTKEDTRVKGPWSSEDKNTYVPRDIREVSELRPWQTEFINLLTTYDKRAIHVIYDPEGCKGKTILTRWMMCHELGELLPCLDNYKDILQCAYCIGPQKCYFFDLPRAKKKDDLYQMISAIETLKSGMSFDTRYSYKRRLFDPPGIGIFTNRKPSLKMLSKDMWHIWTIDENYCLQQYKSEDANIEDL